MANDPMLDYLAMINSQRATIPGPGKVTPQNMPLAFQHAMQKHVHQQSQLQVGTPQMEQPGMPEESPRHEAAEPPAQEAAEHGLGVGEPTVERMNKKGKRTGVEIPPMKFTLPGGGQVEVPHEHPASKELIQHLKNTVKPQAAAAEPQAQQPNFMEQLADALTKRRA